MAQRSRFANERHPRLKLSLVVLSVGGFAAGWVGFAAAQPDLPDVAPPATLTPTVTSAPTQTSRLNPTPTTAPGGTLAAATPIPTADAVPTKRARTSRGS